MGSTRASVTDVTKFIALLSLGFACALVSTALMLSFCVAMPILTEQVGMWLKTSQWNALPLSMVLAKMGYVPPVDEAPVGNVIGWLLSFETGFAIVAAACAYGCILWIFQTAVREWGPSNAHLPGSSARPRTAPHPHLEPA